MPKVEVSPKPGGKESSSAAIRISIDTTIISKSLGQLADSASVHNIPNVLWNYWRRRTSNASTGLSPSSTGFRSNIFLTTMVTASKSTPSTLVTAKARGRQNSLKIVVGGGSFLGNCSEDRPCHCKLWVLIAGVHRSPVSGCSTTVKRPHLY